MCNVHETLSSSVLQSHFKETWLICQSLGRLQNGRTCICTNFIANVQRGNPEILTLERKESVTSPQCVVPVYDCKPICFPEIFILKDFHVIYLKKQVQEPTQIYVVLILLWNKASVRTSHPITSYLFSTYFDSKKDFYKVVLFKFQALIWS